MSDTGVYLLIVHDARREDGQQVNATIVSALTCLHPRVPQPDGQVLYHALTGPNRRVNEIVPLATVAFENHGNLASIMQDWEATVGALVALAAARDCDAMPLGLPETQVAALVNGPQTQVTVYSSDRSPQRLHPGFRKEILDHLRGHLERFLQEGPFWPGDIRRG